jgi:hypothetical protein
LRPHELHRELLPSPAIKTYKSPITGRSPI